MFMKQIQTRYYSGNAILLYANWDIYF